jgi:hypothetical protein
MIDKKALIECINVPMEQYYREMTATLSNWQPLEDAAKKLLQGQEVRDDEVPAVYLPLIKMMRVVAQVNKESDWDWANPAIQDIFKNKAESQLYKIFTNVMVGTVSLIVKRFKIGTLVEVGTGPGKVTASLCEEMSKNNINIPIIISDRAPGIMNIRDQLQQSFSALTFKAFIWDIRESPPEELVAHLKPPVLLFERFCLPYAGHDALDMIAPIADILILQDDLSLTGKKLAYDILYGKMGTQFLTYRQTREHLGKYFSFIHTCDREITKAISSSVTTFTLAIK